MDEDTTRCIVVKLCTAEDAHLILEACMKKIKKQIPCKVLRIRVTADFTTAMVLRKDKPRSQCL